MFSIKLGPEFTIWKINPVRFGQVHLEITPNQIWTTTFDQLDIFSNLDKYQFCIYGLLFEIYISKTFVIAEITLALSLASCWLPSAISTSNSERDCDYHYRCLINNHYYYHYHISNYYYNHHPISNYHYPMLTRIAIIIIII